MSDENFETEDNKESRQEADADRRRYKIGKSATDAFAIKLDRVRKIDFRTSSIIHMERKFQKKSWKILADLNLMDWSHEDTINLIWAGLLHEYPDIEDDDIMLMWDGTLFDDRMKAFSDLIHALAKVLGAPVNEKVYKEAMAEWDKQQKATRE
jgi:hypothetical protein